MASATRSGNPASSCAPRSLAAALKCSKSRQSGVGTSAKPVFLPSRDLPTCWQKTLRAVACKARSFRRGRGVVFTSRTQRARRLQGDCSKAMSGSSLRPSGPRCERCSRLGCAGRRRSRAPVAELQTSPRRVFPPTQQTACPGEPPDRVQPRQRENKSYLNSRLAMNRRGCAKAGTAAAIQRSWT